MIIGGIEGTDEKGNPINKVGVWTENGFVETPINELLPTEKKKPIKPWFNDLYPLPTKPWKNMSYAERNIERSRRFTEESKLMDNCKKLKLKKAHRGFKKGEELFFKVICDDYGGTFFLISRDAETFDPYGVSVFRRQFDYVDE
jgi:hypothetical protein